MSSLLSQSYFALFLIIAVGILIGHIRYKGVSLDFSAIIFVAIVMGHFGIIIPEDFNKIGVLLFIFTIGLQSGPGFFDSFRKQGLQLVIITVAMIVASALTAIGLGYLFNIDFKIGVGLLTGALTSTPGLAAAIESCKSPIASIGYGIAYPFGGLGVIVYVRLLPKLIKVDLNKDAES